MKANRIGSTEMDFIWEDPNRISGEPCFSGTRVPVKTLFDYLMGGDTLEDFLEGFQSVSREHALKALELLSPQ